MDKSIQFLNTIMNQYSVFKWGCDTAKGGTEFKTSFANFNLIVGHNTNTENYYIIVSSKRENGVSKKISEDDFPAIKDIFKNIQQWYTDEENRKFWGVVNENLDFYLKDYIKKSYIIETPPLVPLVPVVDNSDNKRGLVNPAVTN